MIPKYELIGIVDVTVRDADGSVVSNRKYNKTTNYMANALAKWLSGTSTSAVVPPTQIGAGNGTPPYGQTGPAATDTVLWSPIATTQRACDSIQVSGGYYAQYNLTYQTTDPAGFYNELGLFDASNNLWAHVAINTFKSATQTLTAQWLVFMVADTTNPLASITNYMRSTFAKWMTGTTNVTGFIPPTKIQLGTGTGTPQPSDTALWTATALTSKACDMIYISGLYNVQFAFTYQAADPVANFLEAGLFDTGGNLWVHGVISGNKTAGLLMSVVVAVGIVGD